MPEETVAAAQAAKALSLNLGATLPGEQLAVALFDYLGRFRETMSQENRDEWDKRGLQLWDRIDAIWTVLGINLKP